MQRDILIGNETLPRVCISALLNRARTGGGVGAFGYMAPELFSNDPELSKETVMYAFGMVIYEVVTGARPLGQRRMTELLLLNARDTRPNRPEDLIKELSRRMNQLY